MKAHTVVNTHCTGYGVQCLTVSGKRKRIVCTAYLSIPNAVRWTQWCHDRFSANAIVCFRRVLGR